MISNTSGGTIYKSPDTDKMYKLEVISGVLHVTPVFDKSQPSRTTIGTVAEVFHSFGTYLRNFGSEIQYNVLLAPLEARTAVLGLGAKPTNGTDENPLEKNSTMQERPLEQMSTMKELNELLSDRLEPVQSEPVQS